MTKSVKERVDELRAKGYGLMDASRIVKREDRKNRLVDLYMRIQSSWFVRRKHILEILDILEEMNDANPR